MNVDNKSQADTESDIRLSQLASVGQIAAGIAHEVRNPLTAVKGFLQLIQSEQRKEYIEIAQSELENALKTLNNLLSVSKPDLEDEEAQTIYIAIELESIINLFQDKLYEVNLKVDLKDHDALIIGKKSQFKKAFFNLIKNAIEAMEGKGSLVISHEVVDNEVVVLIRDTGVGIPSDKLKFLGTPFYTTKEEGTGMGLTQVYTTIYQHGGRIHVDSSLGEGTAFTISLPKYNKTVRKGVIQLKQLTYRENDNIKEFLLNNRETFEERLLQEATNVKDKIDEILRIGNINLVSNAHKLVLFVVEGREMELITFAKQEGVSWARFSLTLSFKLEWVQAIRRTMWDFLYNYEELSQSVVDRAGFFTLEKNINDLIDVFLNHFFISYSKYKDELLEKQKKLVENLSVPIIPINTSICILPLIGTIDVFRASTIQEKVLKSVEEHRIRTLIIDLSGIAPTEQNAFVDFLRIVDGIAMMGCHTILTGLRAEIVNDLVNINIELSKKAEFKGTLQQALDDVVFHLEQ